MGEANGPVRFKIEITRKPPPPPLPSFVCVVCEDEIERDPYNPEFQRPPLCHKCTFNTPSRPQLAHAHVSAWTAFYRAHAIQCAIKQEIHRVRHNF